MKKLLLVAALVAAPAFADSWAMPNNDGGEIVLTDRRCPKNDKLLEVYTYTKGGRMFHGCWTVFDEMVQVIWSDGTRYTYSLDSFYVKSKTTKKGSPL